MAQRWIAFPNFWAAYASKSSSRQWSHATRMTGATGLTWAGKLQVLVCIKCKHYLFHRWTQNLLSPHCSSYSNLSLCTEDIFDCLLVPWPNPFVEQIFVDIHTEFFRDCPTEELSDPPPAIVFALVITPICLIPVMVSLVVLKTKNGDGSSWKPRRLQDTNYFKNFIALFLSQLGETSLFTHVNSCFALISSVTFQTTDLHSLPALYTNSEMSDHMLILLNFPLSSITYSSSSVTDRYHPSILHTQFKQTLEFYCIRGYDNKSSIACKGKDKAYLYWQSSLWWAAVMLMNDKVAVIAEFCIVFTDI